MKQHDKEKNCYICYKIARKIKPSAKSYNNFDFTKYATKYTTKYYLLPSSNVGKNI